MKNVAILGSTGTIGLNTLDIVRRHSQAFRVVALAAGSNRRLLEEQVRAFRPELVSLEHKEDAAEFRRHVRDIPVRVAWGTEGAEEVGGYAKADSVVSAITGINGLRPTLAAVRAGKTVALANKESMVAAGPIIRKEASANRSQIIPVDSEHSGVFQCLAKERRRNVRAVTLTASGGPFFRTAKSKLKTRSVEEALAHPRWKMGKKVTIDSATLMNKGLELIEAKWLFNLEPGQLHILIHPQSIVHALVEMRDGSVIGQLSPTDMRIPIQYALTYPERSEAVLPPLDLGDVGVLEFFPVDENRYPLIRLAYRALNEGDSLPVALNAANEAAVAAFLAGKIRFTDIHEAIRRVMDGHRKKKVRSLQDVMEVDRETKEQMLLTLQQRY